MSYSSSPRTTYVIVLHTLTTPSESANNLCMPLETRVVFSVYVCIDDLNDVDARHVALFCCVETLQNLLACR